MRKLFVAAPAALIAITPASADQLLGQSRIDNANRVILPGGPTLGRWQGQKYIATPDVLQIQGPGSTGDASGLSAVATGASTARSLADRAADLPAGQDFGVTTAATDQASTLGAALGTATAIALRRGTYTLTTPLAIPPASALTLRPGSAFAFSGGGSLSLGAGARYEDQGYGATKDQDAVIRALGATRPTGGQDPFGLGTYSTPIFLRGVVSDAADGGAGLVTNLTAVHNFGGATAKGGRAAIYGVLNQTSATSSSSTNRNYVGVSGNTITRSGDGGTDLTSAGAKGAYFGLHGYCQNFAGQNVFECAGAELNTGTASGTSQRYLIGMSVSGNNATRGSVIDAAYDVGGGSEGGLGPHVGWTFGLNFNDVHGLNPLYAGSTLIGSTWTANASTPRPISIGLDMRGFDPSGGAVVGRRATVGGPFLNYFDTDGSTGLFTVNGTGTIKTVGIQTRQGTTGALGANFYNFNWTGTTLEAWIDGTKVGNVPLVRTAPATSSSTCSPGDKAYDASYVYDCVSANTWRRTAVSAVGSTF